MALLPKVGYNEILFTLKTSDTVKTVQGRNPSTQVLVDAQATDDPVLQLAGNEKGWYCLFQQIPAGVYNSFEALLKSSVPVIKTVSSQQVTVINPPVLLQDHTIVGANAVNEGSNETYTVSGYYSDGSTKLVTSGITWSANAPGGVLSIPANDTTGDTRNVVISATVNGKTVSRTISAVDTTTPSSGGSTTYSAYDNAEDSVDMYYARKA